MHMVHNIILSVWSCVCVYVFYQSLVSVRQTEHFSPFVARNEARKQFLGIFLFG